MPHAMRPPAFPVASEFFFEETNHGGAIALDHGCEIFTEDDPAEFVLVHVCIEGNMRLLLAAIPGGYSEKAEVVGSLMDHDGSTQDRIIAVQRQAGVRKLVHNHPLRVGVDVVDEVAGVSCGRPSRVSVIGA